MTGAQTGTDSVKQAGQNTASKTRELNDTFRRTGQGGVTLISMGVHELGAKAVVDIRKDIASITSFTSEDDPEGMRDFGSISHNGRLIYWMIEHYDKDISNEADDPSNPEETTRVMSIILSTEY